ncbi:hypothetical protein ACMXYW_02160 [Neptuniibacter sp. QD48_55]|uniref:hypothetical protein n=1 Tax=Neptuniibacter sp. QD48_55 TaxID=3398212 RepID=UPI0039F62CD8
MQPQAVLLSAFSSLAVPFGYERSCKLTARTLNQDRFLLTQHKNCFGSDSLTSLLGLAGDLEMPSEGLGWIQSRFDKAELVHLGYENERGEPLCKLYLEYPYPATASEGVNSSKGFLLHQAIKWYPNSNRHLITDYRCLPSLSKKRLFSFVEQCLGPSGRLQSLWVKTLLERVCKSELPMILDVSEPESVRRSFDINLYDFSIRIGELKVLLEELFQSFLIPTESVDLFFEQNYGCVLGHVSGGINRTGEPFITLYFGVEERCGK